MKLEQSFEIAAPLEQVWEALIDLERVAPCLPGAAITHRDEEGVYHGTFVVKLGPATASYNGTVRIDHVDAASHTATMHAKGTDKRGQGGATAVIVNRLSSTGEGTRVDAETDMNITGRLARFGRPGMIQDVSNRMLREFSTCLQERLGADAPAPSPAAQERVVAGDAAPDLSADLAAEGREAANATPMAATHTGAPTGMAGGALSTPPATDPDAGVAGIREGGPAAPAPPSPGGASSTPPAIESAPPVQGLSIMAGVVGDQLKRNSAPLAAAIALLLLLLAILRGRR